MAVGVETERKFIIRTPVLSLLEDQVGYEKSEIVQTYFVSDNGVTHRVRARAGKNATVYTETKKTRISRMSVIEDEVKISEAEYLERLAALKTVGMPVRKTRHVFSYDGHLFEVDIYPGWKHHAIMEVEFSSEDERIQTPPFIEIVREVTGEKKYSNHSMALAFPEEPTVLV